MGQYYRIALVEGYKNDRPSGLKVIKPDGYKLLEHGYYGTRTMNRVEKVLENDWYCVMWIGDYADCAPLVWTHEVEDMENITYDNENDRPEDFMVREDGYDYYLVNKYKKQYINMTEQEETKILQDNYGFVIHPLAILCRVNGEFGGGDYCGDRLNIDLMGSRAGNEIKVVKREKGLPFDVDGSFSGYRDCTHIYQFKE